ncbi:hypothetical protein EYF80_057188 [Liparis tanakae]|uniref:Uncharacterized protein n=1 Tax=Liparis tanakae TaxID=230148 RepID=A0A4Z2EUN5_9TELE|nr:hypothetical protein EYF80_057188 [Liparis tanakae]
MTLSQEHSTPEKILSGLYLYLGSTCTWALPVPGLYLYLGSTCTWALPVPGLYLYLQVFPPAGGSGSRSSEPNS